MPDLKSMTPEELTAWCKEHRRLSLNISHDCCIARGICACRVSAGNRSEKQNYRKNKIQYFTIDSFHFAKIENLFML